MEERAIVRSGSWIESHILYSSDERRDEGAQFQPNPHKSNPHFRLGMQPALHSIWTTTLDRRTKERIDRR